MEMRKKTLGKSLKRLTWGSPPPQAGTYSNTFKTKHTQIVIRTDVIQPHSINDNTEYND